MSVRIRLARCGSKKRPYYHVVVADVRCPRDGRFLECLGTFNPLLPAGDENRVRIDRDRAADWLSKGALPTDRVLRFLADLGLRDRPARKNPKKGLPGKKATERLEAKAAAAQASAEA